MKRSHRSGDDDKNEYGEMEFYADDEPLGLVDKAHAIGRQASALPARVTVIQSEIENFPYQRLKKSVRTTMLEAAAHVAAGATGIAFNVLSQEEEPLDEYRPFLDAVGAALVADHDTVLVQVERGVRARDAGARQHHRAVGRTADQLRIVRDLRRGNDRSRRIPGH